MPDEAPVIMTHRPFKSGMLFGVMWRDVMPMRGVVRWCIDIVML